MRKTAYYYSDNDDYTDTERDICGEDYKEFIDKCFEYCTLLSFDVPIECSYLTKDIIAYEKHIDITPAVYSLWQEYYNNGPSGACLERKYFVSCNETKEFLYGFNSIFSYLWEDAEKDTSSNMRKFENLIFYRDDLSVFFKAETHEGYCFMYPEENEDVKEIVGKNGWDLWDDYGKRFLK